MPEFDDVESSEDYEKRRTFTPLRDVNGEINRAEQLALPVDQQPYPLNANTQEFKDWFKKKYRKEAIF